MNLKEEGSGEDSAGINGVVLSPNLLTALFAEVLVPLSPLPVVPETRKKSIVTQVMVPDPIPVPDPAPLLFAGENRRNICLLVSLPGKDVLPAKTRAFLEKMLSACQLGLDDLAIVNTRLSPVSGSELIARFAPEKWLIAGISPATLGIDVPETHFEVLPWQGGEVLSLPALATVDQDSAPAKQLKRQLWSGLQKLFGL